MTTTAADQALTALDPLAIDRLPWAPLQGSTGAAYKVLWRSGAMVQTLVHYHEGGWSAGEPHPAHHHVWVISGAATIAGRRLTAGSYVHVPPGLEHPTTDVGPEGATLLVLYLPAA
ncbi:MAG TPA: hypothetical protein VLC50_06360 [Actinomycetes bacterium]|nr:hypothetical protein [Actinomycetes bacterium]